MAERGPALRTRARKWLPRKDLNLDKQDQNLLCYRYTTGHRNSISRKDLRPCAHLFTGLPSR